MSIKVSTIGKHNSYRDLKLHIGGGIGDSLKLMTIDLPLQDYCDKTGRNIYIAYGGPYYNDCGWDQLLKENIFDRSDNLHWIPDKEYEKLKLSDAHVYFSRNKRKYETSKPLSLNGDIIPIDKSKYNIAIQLQGNSSGKRWEHYKYNELCTHLLSKNKDAIIYILDQGTVKVKSEHFRNERVVNMIGKSSFFQNMMLLKEMDLFIGPESFSKYVCLWTNVRQILLVHEVKHCSPDELLKNHFSDELLFNDRVKLVGIDYDENYHVSRIVDDVKKIEIKEVIDVI